MFLSRLDLDKNLLHFIDRELPIHEHEHDCTYIIYVVNMLQFMRRGGKRNETGTECSHVISTFRIYVNRTVLI